MTQTAAQRMNENIAAFGFDRTGGIERAAVTPRRARRLADDPDGHFRQYATVFPNIHMGEGGKPDADGMVLLSLAFKAAKQAADDGYVPQHMRAER